MERLFCSLPATVESLQQTKTAERKPEPVQPTQVVADETAPSVTSSVPSVTSSVTTSVTGNTIIASTRPSRTEAIRYINYPFMVYVNAINDF